MQTHFQDNKSDELILFLNGWGTDERPFSLIKSRRDILYLFDYSFLDFEFDFSKYKKIILVAFSAGVFMSAYLQEVLPKCDLKIAVNGTLKFFDEKFGLPQKSVSMMQNVSLENYKDLRRKLISDETHLQMFNKNQPLRDIESSLNELSELKKYSKEKIGEFEFDKVVMGKYDEILPFGNQKRAWAGHKNTRVMNSGHFLFYNFSDFDELINL